MRLIMKFGGTSLSDGERVRNAAKLIAKYAKEGNKIAVIVSAMGDTTDELINACESAGRKNQKSISKFILSTSQRHMEALRKAVKNKTVQNKVARTIKTTLNELENVLTGIAYLGEVTAKTRDYVLSFGERLSAPIMWGALSDLELKSEWYTGKDAGIVTDSNFGNANPLMKVTRHEVKEKLEPQLEKNIIPVITGFIAADQDGAVTTLGRGGSDYTATLIGSALGADEIWIWTDVDGLMTADPKIEVSARTILTLSFPEAMEMAYFGAKTMHPRALETAMQDGINVRIRNTFNPNNPGTLIIKEIEEVKADQVVKAVSLIRKVSMITVSGAGLVGAPEIAAKLFELLGKNDINILMISQGSSQANISFVTQRDLTDKAVSVLESSLLGGGLIREITSEDDVCVVALVGAAMKGTPGVAARIFNTLGREKINIRMIAQGSSELNISLVIKETDGEKAVRALHKEFNLAKNNNAPILKKKN
jgi:aspartate kinase